MNKGILICPVLSTWHLKGYKLSISRDYDPLDLGVVPCSICHYVEY